MSAWAARRTAPVAVRRARADERPGLLLVRLLTFFAVTAMSAFAYAQLLHRPPAGAPFAVAAVATACGGALSRGLTAVGGAPSAGAAHARTRATRAAVILVTTLLGLELGLLAVGVPARLVAPWHWVALARAVAGGLAQLGSWSWPYLGSAHWARLSVLMLLVPATTLMALLFFWPARTRSATRRLCALAIAVALALCGMTNAPGGAWRAQGLLLLLLVFAWLWLPTLRSFDANRALGWTAACAVAALTVAPLLSGSRAWIPLAAGEATGPIALQWDQLYGPNQWPRSREPLLTVHASHPPRLLRITSLDRFDGLRFIRSDAPPETAATDIRPSADASWYETTTITIEGLSSNLLVGAAGLTTRVSWHGPRAAAVARAPDGTLSLPVPVASGTSYTVRSYAPKPATEQLRAAPPSFPRSYLPYTEFELPLASASALHAPQLAREASSPPQRDQLVRGPALGGEASGASVLARRIRASPYGPMYALARRLAAGAGSSYEVVERIERYLGAGHSYDEHPPLARYPLEAFLFESRRGYCQQFSGAMTLMLRMDGIPARVGEGFKPVPASLTSPEREEARWMASALDAHAWVEVFFSGIGWIPFDPTPAAAYSAGSPAGRAVSKARLFGAVSPSAARAHASSPRGARARRHAGGERSLGISAWQWALLVLLVALALVAWLRFARTRATDPAGIETAVRELERALHGFAWPLRPGMTLAQIAQRLERGEQAQAAAYVRRLRDLRFGRAHALSAPELSAARAERRALRRALAHGGGLRGRLRALRLLPPHAPTL
jgi:transglutaminase-like putative cysteine protease